MRPPAKKKEDERNEYPATRTLARALSSAAALSGRVRTHLAFFFFNDTATTEIYTLSLHDALPIDDRRAELRVPVAPLLQHPGLRGRCLGHAAAVEDEQILRHRSLAYLLPTLSMSA